MDTNLYLKNIRDFIVQKEYKVPITCEGMVRCFYLDAASYNNLGDQAIALSMELFLNDIFGKENVNVFSEKEVIHYIKSLKKQIRPGDIIALSGGGNMGDLYPRYEALRRILIKNFKNNRIVVFPQTVDYSCGKYGKREFDRGIAVYKSHPDLFVCVRERNSFDILIRQLPNVVLVQDIVFYLYGKIFVNSKNFVSNQVGLCLRKDKESLLSKEQYINIEKKIKEQSERVFVFTTMAEIKEQYDFLIRKKLIVEKLKEISACKVVVTDRLHGMIFSLLAGVPCVAVDNSNHKVSNVADTIDYCTKGIFMCSDIQKIPSIINNDFKDAPVSCDLASFNYYKLEKIMRHEE